MIPETVPASSLTTPTGHHDTSAEPWLGIETVLRRGLVYGLLTATVVAVYLIVTTMAGARLGRGPLPGVVGAALVAVGLTPLRDRLQAAADRLVYGDRRDLHDGLGPSLSGVGLGLQALQDARAAGREAAADQLLARIRQEVTTAVREVRRILDDLCPAVLDRTWLPDAIRRHAAAVSTGPLEVSVDAAADLSTLPPAIETAAYRITQEALTNVVRHADAHHAHVTLDTSDAALTVTVSDDGHGINGATHPGLGLTSMRQRAQALRGTLRVDSGDHGTTVVATLPLQDGSP